MFKKIFSFVIISLVVASGAFYKVAFAVIGDYAGVSFDTGGNINTKGAVFYNNFFWLVDDLEDKVYKYNSSGIYTGTSFDVAGSGAANATGIAAYNDFFWITDNTDDEVYKYNADGTYASVSFDTTLSGSDNPLGITAYNDFFWITDDTDDEVYKYNPDGTYASVSFDTAASGAGNPTGIVQHDGFFWITDNSDDEVYKYNTGGTYASFSFDTVASEANAPQDIASDNSSLWIMNSSSTSSAYGLFPYSTAGTYGGEFFDTVLGGANDPIGITFYDDSFWVIDNGTTFVLNIERVSRYNSDGSFSGSYFYLNSAHQGNDAGIPGGIATYDNHLWVLVNINDTVYKYEPDGDYTGVSFSTNTGGGGTNPFGITFYQGYFWIIDVNDREVYKFNPDGTYTGTSFDTAAVGNTSPLGIVGAGGYLWVSSNNLDEVFQYESDGTYTGFSFDTAASGNGDPRELAVNDGFFWIIDRTDDEIYKYEGPEDDSVAPTVSAFLPLDNATDVAVNTNLVITFDEDVNVETGDISIYKADDTLVEAIDVTGLLVTGDGTDTITINPTADLEDSTSFYVQIDATAFDDLAGNSFAGIADETTWSFTTIIIEEEPPTITSSGSRRALPRVPIILPSIPLIPIDCELTFNFSPTTGIKCPDIPGEIISPTLVPFFFLNNLGFGMTHPDVKELQKYLNTHGYPLAYSSFGSLGQETNFFGRLTRGASIKFQQAHDILPAWGFLGPTTRGVINSLLQVEFDGRE